MKTTRVLELCTFALALTVPGFAAKPLPVSTGGIDPPSICDAVHGNLVVNCGFETGTLAGWTLTNGDGYEGVFGVPYENSGQSYFYDGTVFQDSTLSQTIPTVAGQRFTVSFYLEADSSTGPTSEFIASINGVRLYSETNPAPHGYVLHTFTGVASGPSVLKFQFRNDPGYFNFDDVIVLANGNTSDGPFQVRYASNLTQGDSVVNITNTGANGNNLYGPGFGTPDGNICVNVYAFSPDEQMISCCSCLVTPNGLVHVTANNDLVSNTLTGVRPNSIVIKLVATATGTETHHHSGLADTNDPSYSGSDCTNSAALVGTRSFPVTDAGLLAWGTTLHSASNNDPPTGSAFSITETPFLPATLDPTRLTERNIDGDSELASLASRCTNIIGNGSSFGICRSCRLGGLGGAKQ